MPKSRKTNLKAFSVPKLDQQQFELHSARAEAKCTISDNAIVLSKKIRPSLHRIRNLHLVADSRLRRTRHCLRILRQRFSEGDDSTAMFDLLEKAETREEKWSKLRNFWADLVDAAASGGKFLINASLEKVDLITQKNIETERSLVRLALANPEAFNSTVSNDTIALALSGKGERKRYEEYLDDKFVSTVCTFVPITKDLVIEPEEFLLPNELGSFARPIEIEDDSDSEDDPDDEDYVRYGYCIIQV